MNDPKRGPHAATQVVCAVVFLACSAPAFAETTVNFLIVDAENNRGVPSKLTLTRDDNTRRVRPTDADGRISLDPEVCDHAFPIFVNAYSTDYINKNVTCDSQGPSELVVRLDKVTYHGDLERARDIAPLRSLFSGNPSASLALNNYETALAANDHAASARWAADLSGLAIEAGEPGLGRSLSIMSSASFFATVDLAPTEGTPDLIVLDHARDIYGISPAGSAALTAFQIVNDIDDRPGALEFDTLQAAERLQAAEPAANIAEFVNGNACNGCVDAYEQYFVQNGFVMR